METVQTSESGGVTYLLEMNDPPSLVLFSNAGHRRGHHTLWSPGSNWRASSLSIADDHALISFSNANHTEFQLAQYSLSGFYPISSAHFTTDTPSTFACTDWHGTFSFLTTRYDRDFVLTAR